MTPPINPFNEEKIRKLFKHNTGVELSELLVPISEEQPSGESLKGNGIYNAIKQARSADDPNLPMGVWQHNLKVADWDEVSNVAIGALANKTKDLQISIWFLEAQIHKYGFAGIAPAIYLIIEMIETFWVSMHPRMEDDDLDYRTNLIVWLNEKLQPALRQLPITDTQSDIQYSWADWEMAVQVEQLPDDGKVNKQEYVTTQKISQGITATSIEFYRKLYQDISDAVFTLDQFTTLLDAKCGNQSPSLSGFKTLLLEIRETLVAHVPHLGLFTVSRETTATEQATEGSGEHVDSGGDDSDDNRRNGLNNRERAYAQLAEAAEYLMRDDPHSPVPYLVLKAIEWGKLNTAELYQQLFIEYQGQLNIFEMLGLEVEKQ